MTKPYILCVDDEPTILLSLKAQLKNIFGNQFFYEIAESAEDAWEVIDELSEDEEHIVLIISDWLMPNTKGDDFLIDVHQHFPKVVKIMLTGQADPVAVERAEKDASLAACLQKPWSCEELEAAIKKGLAAAGAA